jgi:anti-sigma B factor antagonist
LVISNEQRSVNAGLLKLRMEKFDETCVVQLNGELDMANADAVERELQAALSDGVSRVIVDMGGLTFIDSTGIALLVTAAGEDNGNGRVGFLHSRAAAVTRVLELTGVADRLPFVEGVPELDGDGSVPA